MPQITAITPQRRKGRFSIFVDNEFVVGVGEKVVADLGLRVGKPIDAGELSRIVREEEVRRATENGLRLLELRPRSQREFEQQFRQKGYEPEVITEAIAVLARWGFVDDTQFAEQWVQSRSRARPAGARKLRAELAQKGVAKEKIEKAVEGLTDEGELGLARAALAKKARALPADKEARREEWRRLAGFLQRRGFGWETVKKALAEIFDADPDEIGEE